MSLEKRSVEDHITQVEKALDRTLRQTIRLEKEPSGIIREFDINKDSFIIVSDIHKGARNLADDFRLTEKVYNSMLAYYYSLRHTLVILGDSEELWEEKPKSVIKSYRHTFELEANFHKDKRYIRIWGNHDDIWQSKRAVNKHLKQIFGAEELYIHEGLRISVVDESEKLGMIFLVHGHQGDMKSDPQSCWSIISRLFVRHIWRRFQRLTGISKNTPAKDWKLRKKYNIAMYEWAKQQDNLVLIAGHTHRPVFKSKTHEIEIQEEIKQKEKEMINNPTEDKKKEIALLKAKLEWIIAQENQEPEPGVGDAVEMSKPCYFNTGCCCFSDGDITGIEIADGKIKLIHWPNREDEPEPLELEGVGIREVFNGLRRQV